MNYLLVFFRGGVGSMARLFVSRQIGRASKKRWDKCLKFNTEAAPVTPDFIYNVYKGEENLRLKIIFSNFALITDLAKFVVHEGMNFLSFERPVENNNFAFAANV